MYPDISSAKAVIGHPRAGMCRRPIVPDALWNQVVNIMANACQSANTRETLGVGFLVRFGGNISVACSCAGHGAGRGRRHPSAASDKADSQEHGPRTWHVVSKPDSQREGRARALSFQR